jgi:hypothetical protein
LGGFFPLILSRDYGWPALVAFTVFNVGGAAAMGFYFKQKSQQTHFVTKHKVAIGNFSYITIAYQLFFVAWLGAMIGQMLLLPSVLLLALLFYLAKGQIRQISVAVYGISFILFTAFWSSDWPPVEHSAKTYWPHAVMPLAIGFILSPYLDITFHKAYRESDKPALSFALGFGVLFLSLIGFVFLYAGSLSEVAFNQAIPSAVIYPIIAFLIIQVSFTIAAHCAELREQEFLGSIKQIVAVCAFSGFVIALVSFTQTASIPWVNIPLHETMYKGFLFFYSLVFPLYLLLGSSKTKYLWVLALCTPAYAVGFLIGGTYSFALSVGVVLIVLAGLFVKNKRTSLA